MNAEPVQVFGDVTVERRPGHVALLTMRRPPNNFFDRALIAAVADALHWCDTDNASRAIVLTSEGKHFCAGAAFSPEEPAEDSGEQDGRDNGRDLYDEAIRIFEAETPIVAAVQGAAIGGGLGVAMAADFRICSPKARFAANFARLGFHHGFGLTVTLPLALGHQRSLDLLYRGRRVEGEEAHAIGLCDAIAAPDELLDSALALAADIAASAPLAVRAIRKTMRGHLADEFRAAVAHEFSVQIPLQQTYDFSEGVRAYAERRSANFEAR